MTKPKNKVIDRPKEIFDDEIVKAFQKTTVEQREMIAEQFEAGRVVEYWREFAMEVLPLALIVASLVDNESRLVFNGLRLKKPTMLELAQIVSKLPQYSTIAHKSVDNSPKSVDNSADNYVENYQVPVDKNEEPDQPEIKLSTPCGKTFELSPVYTQFINSPTRIDLLVL